MRVLHCCLAAFYIDNYSYQENILPKLHKIQGHDVAIVASTETYLDNKALGYTRPGKYINENGIPVNRLPYVKYLPHFIAKKLRIYIGLKGALEEFQPNIIFIHDSQFLSINQIANYVKKKKDIRIYVDGHTDFINSARTWISKNILHKIVYRYCAKRIEPYTLKFYGTLPLRVKFIRDVYRIPENKIDLLELGADDSSFDLSKKDEIRKIMRKELDLNEDDFVIVTGGKIDRRKNIQLLLQAMNTLNNNKIKLILFGSPNNDMEIEIKKLSKNKNILFLGWLTSDKIYNVLFASDLAFFPGTHSVLWEQSVGVGLPCVFRKWEDITHIDVGGNCLFLEKIDIESISNKILEVFNNQELYSEMKKNAMTKGVKAFSYSEIAKRAIQN